MRVIVAVSICLVICSCSSVQTSADKPTKSHVAVVRSLAELRNQPPINLSDGVTIKLGIGDDESYVGGGQILYCLAKSVKERVYEAPGRNRLGPIRYDVAPPRREGGRMGGLYHIIRVGRGETLFCALLKTPVAGPYYVAFFASEDYFLCCTVIMAKSPDPYPWQPLGFNIKDGKKVVFVDPDMGTAIPAIKVGISGIPSPIRLPRLPRPDNVDGTGDFHLSLKGNELIFSFAQPAECFIQENLLWRWWVNGKPVVPHIVEKVYTEDEHDAVKADKISVKLRLEGDKIGACPGDALALQVIYSPWGWETVCPPGTPFSRLTRCVSTNLMMVSNRIDFVYEEK